MNFDMFSEGVTYYNLSREELLKKIEEKGLKDENVDIVTRKEFDKFMKDLREPSRFQVNICRKQKSSSQR